MKRGKRRIETQEDFGFRKRPNSHFAAETLPVAVSKQKWAESKQAGRINLEERYVQGTRDRERTEAATLWAGGKLHEKRNETREG